jgi:hypothetical protein
MVAIRYEHVYVGWAVTLPNGNIVNFTNNAHAVEYWIRRGVSLDQTVSTINCGMDSRGFCGHCQNNVTVREKQ